MFRRGGIHKPSPKSSPNKNALAWRRKPETPKDSQPLPQGTAQGPSSSRDTRQHHEDKRSRNPTRQSHSENLGAPNTPVPSENDGEQHQPGEFKLKGNKEARTEEGLTTLML
eukprot:5440337-Heterocapsa_arctica.AAC.1